MDSTKESKFDTLESDLEQLENRLNQFNLFNVLNIETTEKQHSAVIRWLLDPKASHRLGKNFLKCFLLEAACLAKEKGIANIPSPADVNSWNLKNVNVLNERHFIDILALSEKDEFVCLIENKIRAPESSDQLSSYLARVKYEYPRLSPFPIFLTPDGKLPSEKRDQAFWVPMDYGRVEELIERVLRNGGSTINESVRSFLEQYSCTLRRYILEKFDENTVKALRFYYKHERTVGFIMQRVEEYPKQVSKFVESAVSKYARDLEKDVDGQVYLRYYAKELDKIYKLKNRKDKLDEYSWTSSGRIVLFEYNRNSRNLNLVLGAGPKATRAHLFKLAKKHPSFNPKTPQKEAPSNWHRIYRKKILSKCDYEIVDIENAKKKVEEAIQNFYKKDYWYLVNAIRESYE